MNTKVDLKVFRSIDKNYTLLIWDGIPGVTNYEIWYGEGFNDFDLQHMNTIGASEGEMQYLITNLDPNKAYSFRVRSIIGSNYGEFSNTVKTF